MAEDVVPWVAQDAGGQWDYFESRERYLTYTRFYAKGRAATGAECEFIRRIEVLREELYRANNPLPAPAG